MDAAVPTDSEGAVALELVAAEAVLGESTADLQRALRQRDRVIAVLRGQVSARDQRIAELEERQSELLRPRASPEIAELKETIADLQRRLWVQRRLQTDPTGAVSLVQPATLIECAAGVVGAGKSINESRPADVHELQSTEATEATQYDSVHAHQHASKQEHPIAASPSCVADSTGSMALLGRLAAVKAQVKAPHGPETVSA